MYARSTALLSAVLALAGTAPALAASKAEPAAALARRCVAAYGGEAALARSAAAVQEGRVTSIRHPGASGRIGRAYARPGRLRVETAFPGEPGEIRVLDGARGWRDGREAAGPPLQAMVLQAARLDLVSLLSSRADAIVDRGTRLHDGKPLRVLAVPVGPGLEVEAALDPATARIVRSRGASLGEPKIEFVTAYSDFRTVDGVLVPFRERNWANGKATGETVLERVVFVADHPAGMFRP